MVKLKSSKNRLLALIACVAFVAAAFALYIASTTQTPSAPVAANAYRHERMLLGEQPLDVEIADTEALRALGLSGRDGLAAGTGMLFVFDRVGTYRFWMKDMKFAIDMIWISDDLHVVGMAQYVQPESYPETFAPRTPARYVVELPAGFAYAHGIAEGTVVALQK